jgi:DNA polymerase III alpha subunit
MNELSVQLSDRELRFDGISIVSPQQVAGLLLRGATPSTIRISGQLSQDIELFNRMVPDEEQLVQATAEPVSINLAWQLPPEYLEVDVYQVVGTAYDSKIDELSKRYTAQQQDAALQRISDELAEFEKRGMTNFLRTIIYILAVFRENNVVWGVGRGSSCASYVLFILGLHSVDCVWYNVPMEEFFHD